METRACKRCPYTGDVDSFPEAGTIKGIKYYRHLCTKCYSGQKRTRIHAIRQLLDTIKQQAVCVRCGVDDWRVLEWHHSDANEKDFCIADAARRGLSTQRIKQELEKCIPLCANCHRIVEYEIRTGCSSAR